MRSKKRLNVLLLGAGNRISWCEWFISTCDSFNVTAKIFSYEIDKTAPIMKYAKIIQGLSFADKRAGKEILKIIKNKKINIVIPFMDSATVALSAISDESRSLGCLPVISSLDICLTFENKLLAKEWFFKNKIRTPRLFDKDGLKNFPAIAKNRLGFGSRGIFAINDRYDFDYFKKKIDNDRYFVEEFVKGAEYTIDAYVGRNNKILNIIPRLRIKVVNGEVNTAKIVRDKEMINFARKILSSGNFYGPITLQIIKDTSGKLYAIEINPRFGGGVILSFKAGANSIKYILQEYFNKKISKLSWNDNILMMRVNREIWTKIYDKKKKTAGDN